VDEKAKSEIKVITTGIVLVFSLVALFAINGALAWFAHNDEVGANGMNVDVSTSANLVIGKTEAELTNPNLQFFVSFENDAVSDMIAVTHDPLIPDSYLKHLISPHAVDHHTGNAKDGMTLEFEAVPSDGNGLYFIDYTVYIASAFKPLEVSSLVATIVPPASLDEDDDHPYFNAASIDFYLDSVSEDNYCGTTSVSDSMLNASAAGVEIMSDGGDIPLAGDGSIKIIMRCYFDGALQDPTTNRAYINSITVKTDGIVFGVHFKVTDAAPQQ
jgi:hypothetical protein